MVMKDQPATANATRRSSLTKNVPPKCNTITTACPYYANSKFDLYYPEKYPKLGHSQKQSKEATLKKCPMTAEAVEYIVNLDLAPVLDEIDVNRNKVLRKIQRLDEKLNSPVCKFLEAYQPDIHCSCEEASRLDGECPCPAEKEPLNFNLMDWAQQRRWHMDVPQQTPTCVCDETKSLPIQNAANQKSAYRKSEKDEIERQVKALDDKLLSPEFHFLKPLQPEQIARCACKAGNFLRAHCACQPMREPIDFRNKSNVKKKIEAIDSILNFPDLGLSCNQPKSSSLSCGDGKRNSPNYVASTRKKSNLKYASEKRLPGSCLPNCPPPKCRCGKDCPAKPGPFQEFPGRTFHVPECPSDRAYMLQPRSPVQGMKACPFSPACCPIGEVCPFPVLTVYDPSAPPLPSPEGGRRCPFVPTKLPSSSQRDSSALPCPLDPLKPPRGPTNCPLSAGSGCPMGQNSNCPLLSCSLGPLKTFVFDGNEECPFCHNKCCPMISPDGPGCPISVSAAFCPLGNTDACCLKNMTSPPSVVASSKISPPDSTNDGESCPIGELLEANAAVPGCRCSGQRNPCPLTPPQPCPATAFPLPSSCHCASPSAPVKNTRPESCPLKGISIPQSPAPPCPLTMSSSKKAQCRMASLGDKNFDASCPVSNMFQCPALKAKPSSFPTSIPNVTDNKLADSASKLENAEQKELHIPQPTKDKDTRHLDNKKKKQQIVESISKPPKRKFDKKNAKEAVVRNKMSNVRKSEKEMTKTFSRMSNSVASSMTQTTAASSDRIFEVSLETLPRPPLSDTMLLGQAQHARTQRSSKYKKDDMLLVKQHTTSKLRGIEQPKGKQKPKNCPIPDPERCPLEVPECPFGPPEPSCPLAKTSTCPITANQGCMTGKILNSQNSECPAKTTPCEMFPEGHCPMENLNMCECKYPIAACLEPLIPLEDAQADEQYCSRLDCCMGLPLPPIKPSEEFETDTWYAYTDVKPGNPATKHYLEILDVPPEPEFFVSMNAFRKHPAWKILKCGEGYKECKRIKQILAERGPTSTLGTQFVEDELPDDEEIEIIENNKKEAARIMELVKLSMLRENWVE